MYCRTFQKAFRTALPVLPYRKPEILHDIKEIPEVLQEKTCSAVLLVTDKSIREHGLTERLEKALAKAHISCPVFETVVNPTTDVIEKAQQYGNAVTSLPYNEQIFVVSKDDERTTTQFIPRETLRRVSTPQAYRYDLLDEKYHEAFDKEIGIYGSHYTNTMMVELGVRLHFAKGSDKNIKLTTKDDLELFKGYLTKGKDNWLK